MKSIKNMRWMKEKITAFRRQNQQKTFLVYAKETSHNPNLPYFLVIILVKSNSLKNVCFGIW